MKCFGAVAEKSASPVDGNWIFNTTPFRKSGHLESPQGLDVLSPTLENVGAQKTVPPGKLKNRYPPLRKQNM